MTKKEYRACLPPYDKFWSAGPYLSKQDNRLKITLLGGGLAKSSSTMTYAKYLYAASTGVIIEPGTEVDHIDGNKYNDSITNLEALTKEEHKLKTKNDPTRIAMRKSLTLICLHCQTEFTIPYGRSYLARGGNASYCSPNCAKHSKKHMHETPTLIKKERVQDQLPRLFEPWEAWSRVITDEVIKQLPVKKGSALNSLTRARRKCPTCLETFTPAYPEQTFCSAGCSNRRRGRKTKVDETALVGVLKRVHRKELSYAAAGRILGVSDNAVRKRYLKAYSV